MNIVVLNGSPKGSTSVTVQYVRYIQKTFPQHELKLLNISREIKSIEADENAFQDIIEAVRLSDGVLWASPVYFFLVPSQYKRFIEMISERKSEHAFSHKYTAVLTTSIHVFDHTAHNYMHAVCDDLNMKHAGSFSAHMKDLLHSKERKRLVLFAEHFFECIGNKGHTSALTGPVTHQAPDYAPGSPPRKVNNTHKKILVLTESDDNRTNLGKMIDRFKASFSLPVETVNFNNLDIRGGCLGCIHCGFDNTCIYEDEFVRFYDERLRTADVLVWAGTIKGRFLSAAWKQFIDRSFFRNHAPSFEGKQMGFIISGALRQNSNLRQVLEVYVEYQQANLVGIVTDECGDSAEIDASLHDFAERLIRFAEAGYVKPPTFLSVGAMKIIRDAVWGGLRFIFQADHRYYKAHGLYDFPQKDIAARARNAVMVLLMKIPAFRKEVVKKIEAKMIEPYQKILED